VGEHVAVVLAVDVDHFLALDAVGPEEHQIHAERPLPDLREHVFVLTELAVDPLALDHGAGVVLDVGLDAGEALAGHLERRLERMRGGCGRRSVARVDVALRQAALRHEAGEFTGLRGRLGWSLSLAVGRQ
jgi:hypothetical protein